MIGSVGHCEMRRILCGASSEPRHPWACVFLAFIVAFVTPAGPFFMTYSIELPGRVAFVIAAPGSFVG